MSNKKSKSSRTRMLNRRGYLKAMRYQQAKGVSIMETKRKVAKTVQKRSARGV